MFFQLTTTAIWGGLIVIFLIIEGVTAGLASIWFAIGAAAGLIASLCHAPLWLQTLLFAVVSALTLWLTRPLAKKFINGRTEATNADRIIGGQAVVKERIDALAGTGAVLADGKMWSARSTDGQVIETDTIVTVREIQGVKLMVEPDKAE